MKSIWISFFIKYECVDLVEIYVFLREYIGVRIFGDKVFERKIFWLYMEWWVVIKEIIILRLE